jgi:hypothetical protein
MVINDLRFFFPVARLRSLFHPFYPLVSLTHGLIPGIGGKNGKIKANDPAKGLTGSITVHQTGGRSGRTPALP